MRLTLAENFRAIFYTPFYLLKALGLAEQAGLTLEWLPPGSPGGAIDAIKEGRVDLTWGGPMRVMKDHDTTPANGQSLLCFGEVVSRDPFFCLVKRHSDVLSWHNSGNFAWHSSLKCRPLALSAGRSARPWLKCARDRNLAQTRLDYARTNSSAKSRNTRCCTTL